MSAATARTLLRLLVGGLAITAYGCGDSVAEPPGPDPGPTPVFLDKIDPQVQSRMTSSQPIPVMILGRTQLLDGPEALDAFIASNAGRPRPSLRAEVIRQLKTIAEAERAAILATLADPRSVDTLWIVNAVSASLTADDIRAAAISDAVKYIYLSDGVTSRPRTTGGVSQILSPVPRSFDPAGKTVPWNVARIGAERVWSDLDVAGRDVVIALLDTGAQYTHDDLRGGIWINRDEIPNNQLDDDLNGYVDDHYGFDFADGDVEILPAASQHGTYVAGILVGDGTGGIVTGIAPEARVMTLVRRTVAGDALALQYALENGADVANMSFSRPDLANFRGFWRLMADHAVAAGLVLVSGAGNFGQTRPIPEQLRIPEGIPSVIAVGGVDENLQPVPFSSRGPVTWSIVKFYGDFPLPIGLVKPDVAAFPGPRFPILDPGGGYLDPNTSLAGNSFSSPHVAGIIALILSARPDLNAWDVRRILEETAVDLEDAGKDNVTGWGLVDGYEAVSRALGF